MFLGYAEGTKAYRLYDPRGDKVTVSRDVVFNEEAAWDWHSPSTGEAGGFTNTFIVEHLVIHGDGDATEQVPRTPGGAPSTLAVESSTSRAVPSTSGGMPSTPGGVPSTPGGMPSMPRVVPGGSTVVVTTPGRVLSTPVAESRRLAVVPTTPRLRLNTSAVVPSTTGAETSCPGAPPSTQAEQGTPSTPIEFASPPSDITEFVEAYHEGEEVRFRRLDDIVGGTGLSGPAGRLLNDKELLFVSAKEPPMFALAECNENWRWAMLEEMKAIEENET